MKKKYGPLPLWAWVVVIGGTIGVYLLVKSNSSANPSATTDAQLAAEQAAEEAAVGAANSGGTSGTTTGATSPDISTLQESLDGINTTLATISANGLTDQPTQTPLGTFTDEVGDVTAGVTAIGALAALFGAGSAPGTPATATSKKNPLPALTTSGAIRLKSGPTKPTAPNGYTVKGIGDGNWEGVPVLKTVVKHVAPAKGSGGTAGTGGVRAIPVSGKKTKK